MTIREYKSAVSISADLIEEYENTASSIVSDSLDRLIGATGLLPYHRSQRAIGTAVTVKTRAGDNLAIHKALEIARPGDVLVIDGGGDCSQALIGEIVVHKAMVIGISGFVIDGAIRDVSEIRQIDMPVFARAVTHRGPYKAGPGIINQPVCIAGMVVMPGDLILGDADGVVALSPELAKGILPAVRAREAHECTKIAALRAAIKEKISHQAQSTDSTGATEREKIHAT